MANPTAGVPTATVPFSDTKVRRDLAATAATYYVGELIGINSSGYAVKCDDTAALVFDGIAASYNTGPRCTVESGDSAGDKKVTVDRPHRFDVTISSATAGDEGKLVYALYSNEVSYSPGTYGNVVGRVVEVLSSTRVLVEPLGYGNRGYFQDDTDYVELDDDFLWYISPHLWTSILTDSGTVAAGDAAGGVITLTASDGTVADNDQTLIKATNETFLFAADKPISLFARVKLTETTANEANIAVGLANAVAADFLADDGAGPPASYSGMVIFKVDGGSVWQGEASVGGTQVTDTNVGAFTSGSWTDLRIDWLPTSSTAGTVNFYVNGTLGGTQTLTFTGATEMQAFACVKNGNGTNNMALLVDRIKVRAKR